MRARVGWIWALLGAVVLTAGCCSDRNESLPPALESEGSVPPRLPTGTSNTTPTGDAKTTGAYGGS